MVSDTVICKLQVLKPQQDSSESLRLLKKGELWPITARNKNPNCCFIKKKKNYAELDNYEGEKKVISIWIPDTCWVLEGNMLQWRFGAHPVTWMWFSSVHINQPGFIITPLTQLCPCSEVILPRAVAAVLRKSFCALPLVVPSSAGAPGWSTGGFFRSDSPLFSAWKSEQEILFPAALKNQGIQK